MSQVTSVGLQFVLTAIIRFCHHQLHHAATADQISAQQQQHHNARAYLISVSKL
jgi:hypothetical protein